MLNIFVVYVENKPGVLTRVASLFRRRAFNIDSLTVGRTEKPEVSRMTITVDTNPDQDDVRLQFRSIGEADTVRCPLGDGYVKFEPDAVVAVPGLDDVTDKPGERPGQQPRLAFDHRDFASQLRRSTGSLEPDNAAANDHDAGPAMERLAQMQGVFDIAKIMHARISSPGRLDLPRLGAGREKKPVVAEELAVVGCDGLSLRIACDDGSSGNHRHVKHAGPIACRLEIGNRRVRCGQQFFRQLRALVGRVLLLADHGDRAAKAGGTQRFRSTSACLTRASDHYFLDWVHRRFDLPGG